jgi:hypothetical protein
MHGLKVGWLRSAPIVDSDKGTAGESLLLAGPDAVLGREEEAGMTGSKLASMLFAGPSSGQQVVLHWVERSAGDR